MSSTSKNQISSDNSWLAVFSAIAIMLGGLSCNTAAAENIAVSAAKAFLAPLTADLGDVVEISINNPSALIPSCNTPEPFLPANQQLRPGRVVVGVRCKADNQERLLYLQGYIKASGSYIVVKSPVGPGQVLSAAQLEEGYGDLGALPRGTVVNIEEALGKQARIRLKPGAPLQERHLSRVVAINRGEIIELESGGRGFRITRKAEALASGSKGDIIRVRLSRRKIVSAQVIAPGRAKVPIPI